MWIIFPFISKHVHNTLVLFVSTLLTYFSDLNSFVSAFCLPELALTVKLFTKQILAWPQAMLPFNAWNERNMKHEIGNEASGFYPFFSRSNERNRRQEYETKPLVSTLTSRPSQRHAHTDFTGPIEEGNKAERPQSKDVTLLLPSPNRRIGPSPCQGPIERRDYAVAKPNRRRPAECQLKAASPNRRRPAECQSKDATAWVEMHSFFTFILFFPSYFLCLSIWL